MKIDRELQYEILKELEEVFPGNLPDIHSFSFSKKHSRDKILANIVYLKQHQLIDCICIETLNKPMPDLLELTINYKGLDFLIDDGGLSTILNVVTVKLHEDSIKALLLYQIKHSNSLSENQKKSLTDRIQTLPAIFSDKLLEKILERGIDLLFSYSSDIYHSIDTLLSSVNQ